MDDIIHKEELHKMKEINLCVWCWSKKCPKAFIDYDGRIKILDDFGGQVKLSVEEFPAVKWKLMNIKRKDKKKHKKALEKLRNYLEK